MDDTTTAASWASRMKDRLDSMREAAEESTSEELGAHMLAYHNEVVRIATGVDPHWQNEK